MGTEFYPISAWLADCNVWVPTGDSYVHITYALANEENA